MPADGSPGPPLQTSAPGVEAPFDRDAEPPLFGLIHGIDFTWFDSRAGRLVTLALAAAVAVIAAGFGIRAAVLAGSGIALVLVVAVVAIERDRWRAQDVTHWYERTRNDRWVSDTGSVSSGPDPAGAEVWLGAHQPGTVPQLYRALTAYTTRDPIVVQRELAAMPEASAIDRAWKEWVVQNGRFNVTGSADPSELAHLVEALPPSDDRSMFLTWVATVSSARRRLAGDRHWIEPLANERSRAQRTPLGFRRRARIWISRFAVLIMFGVPAVVFSSIGLAIAERGDSIPPEYAQTTYGIRGDLPRFDEQAVVHTLPALARSLSGATRAEPKSLDNDAYNALIDTSLPTFTWTTGEIELAQPVDLGGHRIWSTEVLLGGLGDATSTAIVIVDDADGPAYLYRIDPTVFWSLREAAGLPVASPAP